MKIGVVGIGNIGKAILKGHGSGASQVLVYDRFGQSNYSEFENIKFETNLLQLIHESQIIVLCIRTIQVKDWLNENADALKSKTIVLIQYGLKTDHFPSSFKLIRAITNVNIASNQGHTILLKSKEDSFGTVFDFFGSMGKVILVDSEEDLENISLITGTIPAITGLFIQGLLISQSQMKIGIGKDVNPNDLILDVTEKSLRNIRKTDADPSEYTKSVCTPGGQLEMCIESLKDKGFMNLIENWNKSLKHK